MRFCIYVNRKCIMGQYPAFHRSGSSSVHSTVVGPLSVCHFRIFVIFSRSEPNLEKLISRTRKHSFNIIPKYPLPPGYEHHYFCHCRLTSSFLPPPFYFFFSYFLRVEVKVFVNESAAVKMEVIQKVIFVNPVLSSECC